MQLTTALAKVHRLIKLTRIIYRYKLVSHERVRKAGYQNEDIIIIYCLIKAKIR